MGDSYGLWWVCGNKMEDRGSCMKSANITGISYSVGCAAGVFYLYETRGRAILKVFLKKV